jgi:hypothetical protein
MTHSRSSGLQHSALTTTLPHAPSWLRILMLFVSHSRLMLDVGRFRPNHSQFSIRWTQYNPDTGKVVWQPSRQVEIIWMFVRSPYLATSSVYRRISNHSVLSQSCLRKVQFRGTYPRCCLLHAAFSWLILLPWRRKVNVSLKRLFVFNGLHCIVCQKSEILMQRESLLVESNH